MKYYLTVLLFLLGVQFQAHSQVVTTDPEFPTAENSVTIYFDATQGNGALADYAGDIYAHTGVITDQSSDDSDWKYVIADWSENIPEAKLEQVDTNLYKLDITPSIRDFYGVPQGETIQQMAFVFRNSDGSVVGRASDGGDIYADVYQNPFQVKFTQPTDSLTFFPKDMTITIQGIASQDSNTQLTLFIDNQQVKQVSNDTLEYSYTTQTAGNYSIRLSGSSGSYSDETTQRLVVNPNVTEQNRPSGLKDGITYVDDSTVRLSLFAPHKKNVYVVGDFNNWQPKPEYFMNRETVNADSTWYWIEISGLTPEQEYGFQYLVDGQIRVADPYAEKVLDPNNDPYISSDTYPNIKPYPSGKTDHIVGVLKPGQQAYNWQHTNYDHPEKEELVTYELLVRDFVANHDYQTLTDTLDYLDRLGVNAIELMPIMEFDGNLSWGYNPTFHLATDKYYGPAEDLKKFIDEAHSRNMVVILDMVLNHAWGPSPLVRLWNEGDYGAPTAQNPYLNPDQNPNMDGYQAKHDFNVGYDFNHESVATQYFVDRVNSHWLEEFHFDGFRFDLSKGFTQKYTLGNPDAFANYDASRVQILERMADQIWARDDSAYVILEHFADNTEEKELSGYGMMLWGNLNYNYNQATMGYSDGSNFSAIAYTERGWDNANLMGYMESHDEERLMYKNLQYGNSNGNYDITELTTALNRNKMAAAFFFTIPGPKMIWQFGELGYDVSIDENGRTGEKPIKWEYYSDTERKKLYDTFKALIRLRKSHPAFTSRESKITLDLGNLTKRITITHPDMEVAIIGNFGVETQNMSPDFANTGPWYEFFSGDTLSVSDPDTSMSLQPGEFRVFTTKKFEAPPADLLPFNNTGQPGGPSNGEPPTEFQLHQNYPNPFRPSTTIPFDLPQDSRVELWVYNILGQLVMHKELGQVQAGKEKETQISLNNLSSGVYIYRLKAGSQMDTKKMMLIR